jgi:tRNA(Ile)-lysidine synthase
MYYLFKDYGFTEWDDVVNLLTAMSGKQVHSKTHRLIKDREHLLLQALEGSEASETDFSIESTAIMEPIHLLTREVSAIEEVSKEILYVDKETLNHKLTLRKWKKGDYFYPLGMRGRKKVSKFFKDCKMDAIAKEQQWLLCSDKDIIWIVGMRADERFKITDKTKHILQIRLG